ncbi:MAG: endonuclease, partial [Firmicutes bacterium]|nr:endonuclease [Bacillota bacterium]
RIVLFTVTVLGPIFTNSQKVLEADAVSINVTDTSEANVRSYYSGLNSLNTSQRQGTNLLTNLKPILSNGQTSISYANVWIYGKITDRDWAQSPMTPTELSNYTLGSDNPFVHLLYRNDNGTATAAHADDDHNAYINREHCWPQSYGFSAGTPQAPAGTDVHHLMYADAVNNSTGHSNYFYGNSTLASPNVGTAANHNNTGRMESITYNGVKQYIYEPQDSDKGDIARACFYMVARYSSYTSTYDPWLTLSDSLSDYITVATYSSTSAIGYGLRSVLLEWNALDPVDDYEIHRNNLIYNNVQHNRNPFIDYPSWVDVVWGTGGAVANPTSDTVKLFGQSATAPTALALSPSSSTIAVGGTETLLVTPTPTSASNSVTWSSNNMGVATVTSGVVTGVSAGSATITATSTLNGAITATCAITASAAPVKTLSSISLSGSTSTA